MNFDRYLLARAARPSVLVLALSGAFSLVYAEPPLPVPCSGSGTCGTSPTVNLPFSPTPGTPIPDPHPANNIMQVIQRDQRQIFNWASFNIHPGYGVNFQQPNAGASALNRIYDTAPSHISGSITANGQVILINSNGIIFHNGAQVNVGSLVASSLNIADKDFLNPTFFSTLMAQAGENPVFSGTSGYIHVDAGATLKTATGGSIWLFAPNVTNNGIIQTEEGQVILAAGQKIFLQPSDDPSLRGFLVEVDNGGAASNLGEIIATRGNATLVGIAVNQSNRVSATTSATLNGSIKLLARDGQAYDGRHITASNTTASVANGNVDENGHLVTQGVTLGHDSVTSVTPELGSAQSIVPGQDAKNFMRSKIDIYGHSIQVQDNAVVRATSGTINFTAANSPSNEQFSLDSATRKSDIHVYFAPGSVVDVSGTQNVALAMESNYIQANLQSAQLADAPVQHNGFLKGKTVTVDVRTVGDGKLPVADVSGYVGAQQQTVDQLTTTGGTINVKSEGDIVMRASSRFDVSGGSVRYMDSVQNKDGGFIGATQLTSNGKTYDIATASANLKYDGTLDTGHFESGYTEGKDAGTIGLQAFAYALDGKMLGNTTVGARQQASGKLPAGGKLHFGIFGHPPGSRAFTPSVDFATGATPLPDGYQYGDALPTNLTISTDALRAGGFSELMVYSGGRIHLPSGVNATLADGGNMTLMGLQVAVDGDITIHGGTVDLAAKEVTQGQVAATGLSLGAGAKIDVSGLWVNDLLALQNHQNPTGPLAIDGGTVKLSSQLGSDQLGLVLNAGSVVDVSGGGWVSTSGQVKAGDAGSITLLAKDPVRPGETAGGLQLDGTLLGTALGQGGALTISTPNVRIGTGLASAPGVFTLDAGFFTQGGFEHFNIDGQQRLEVAAGTVIAPIAQNRVLDSSYTVQATGAHLADFTHPQAVPAALRRPVSLTLTALGGDTPDQAGALKIGQDAVIRTDPGSAIKLSAARLLDVNGTLEAPGGSITLTQAEGLSAANVSFSDQAGIWLGSHARLLASGYAKIVTDSHGARIGGVAAGGTVNIAASLGYVMTDAAAVIDVSGASGQVDQLPGTNVYVNPTTIGGDAGSLAISASEGMVLNAQLRGGVAVAGAQAGQLSVSVDEFNSTYDRTSGGYPLGDRTLVLTENQSDLPAAIGVGSGVPNTYNGKAYVAADQLRGSGSGFGAVTLSAEDKIQFASDLNLTGFARSLTLDAPALEASGAFSVNLAAPYLTLANTRSTRQASGSPTAGGAHLYASASRNIDLIGSVNLRGFADSTFKTSGDIRLIGVASDSPTDTSRKGQLASVGDLTFSARQMYPTTLTDFTLRIQDNPHGKIEIDRAMGANGMRVPDMPVLSAGGTLTIQAPTIHQEGVLKAPLGVIVLDAGDYESSASGLTRVADGELMLGDKSITSVSLENQLVPFGSVENGALWQYSFSDALKRNIALPPEKRIELKGAKVSVATNASVNLNGGGDLYASEFLAGPGGSRDVLADPTMFAILPSLGDNVAPFDFQYSNGTSLEPGDSVYLSGGAGLAAGTYTLLPAQYALLPGAFAVQLAPGGKSVLANQATAQIDGSALSAGYRVVAGTDIKESGWSGYVVMPQAVVRNLAEYHDYSANNFFGQTSADHPVAPRLPQDAGQLVLAATQTLNLAPNAVAMAASGAGRGGLLDVVAPKIAVVDATGSFVGYLELTADSLSNMGAASVLLGGRRTTTADGVSIQVGASDVEVENSAASPLSAPDLILAAQDHVTIADGSVIAASGNAGSDHAVLHLDGPGALLRVTTAAQARVDRATTGSGAGLLKVGSHTKLSGASLIFDATGNTTIDETAQLKARAVSLASSQIALGDGPAGIGGLNLTTALLNQVASATDLTLHSYSTIDVYHNAHFDLTQRVDSQGNPLLSSLTLDTGAIVSHLAAGQSEESTAHQITLRNSGAAVSASGSNAGEFILTAKRLDPPVGTAATTNTGTLALQDGAQSITGFSQVDLNAGTQIVASGTGSLTLDQSASGVLALNAPRVTALDKANYTIDAGAGSVRILSPAGGAVPPNTSSLGAQLTIRGASIAQLGTVSLHGGTLTLDATHGDVVLGSDAPGAPAALTDVSGWAEAFADQTRYYPGGKVTLQAEQGKVYVNSNATVDASGARDGDGNAVGDAGQLQISAPTQTAQIDGTLLGAGGAGARGGDFQLDVGTMNGVETLAQKLLDGGFNDSIQWRARSGDIALAQYRTAADGSRSAVKLKAAEILLEAGAGSLNVAAQLDASGTKGGHIALMAQQDITIAGGAKLDVSATGAGNAGGNIDLQSTSGYIALQSGSTFNAAGAAGNGDVRLRALRTASNDDVQIHALDATFNNVNRVLLEAYTPYLATGNITATGPDTTAWNNAATSFMQNFMANTSAKGRLNVGSDSRIQVAPGIEVQSMGDLTLTGDWSLNTWRYDPVNGTIAPTSRLAAGQNVAGQNLVAGVLTLRAGGNLNLNGSLSDGFSNATASGVMQGIDSWSYRLVAGADTARADLGAVQPGVGDVALASNKLVRTGTGFIDIAAGRDVTLQNEASVIYTAGHDTPRLPDYPRLGSTFRNAKFPNGGGDIAIQAGRDIVAAPESELFTPWLYRVGALNADGTINTSTRTSWWVNFPDFKQGVGTLGGGNVKVVAGRDIDNLGVVAPTNGRLAGAANTIPDPANLVVQGGGDLNISAGRDINSGLFYVARGTGMVRAGGSLGSARQGNGNNVYTILGLGEGRFDVTANGDLNLETVVNPTLLPQGSSNTTASAFSTYGMDSAVNLRSLNGNVIFSNHIPGDIASAFSSISNPPASMFQFYPGRLEAAALQGDVRLNGPIVLMPTAAGNLEFFASGSVSLNSTVVLSGANPALLPTPFNPSSSIQASEIGDGAGATGIASVGFASGVDLPGTPVHQNTDAERAYLVARNGDIVGAGGSLSAVLAKPAWIEAGRDVKDLWLQVENHDANTVSTVRAGRDIVYTQRVDAETGAVQSDSTKLAVSGPGRFEVLAGRNIDLGGSNGIVSRGNLDVANLPEKGADLYVLAGLGQGADGRVRMPDYQAFANSYFDGSAAGRQALQDFFANVERQLRLNQALSEADVQQQLMDYRSRFDTMALSEKVMQVFFSELRQGGIQGSSSNYQRGYEAIATLFPGGYQGNINLFNSQIKTESGGDINLLAPGGLVNVGLAKPGNTKLPSDQGIFTDRGGVIRSFSNGDFLVNQSRVFTLQGDDLLLWSTNGNIDAGKGSKTASATPPPLLVFKGNGLVLDTTSAVSGSGIGQLLARSGYKAGEVDLIAPKGDVNAGEAGILVAGNLLIAAQRVLGADNIQVGGVSVGVPAAQSTPITGLSGGNGLADANQGADPTKSLRGQDGQEQLQRIKDALSGLKTSFISVDVVGFGETGASNSDECRGKDGNLDAACVSGKKGSI